MCRGAGAVHAAAKTAAEVRSIEERVLAAAQDERAKKEAASRQKRLEEDRKRREAEAKQRAEVAAKVRPQQLDETATCTRAVPLHQQLILSGSYA